MYEHASERPSNRAAYPNHEFPLAPEAVRAAYAQYWQSIQEPAHSLAARQSAMATTNTLIADFCVDYLTPQTYHAAMLSEQADGLRDPRYKEHALRSLNTYRTASHEPHEDQHFIFGLLSDREVIDDFWRENATQTYANDPTRLALYMDQNNSLAVPREVWRQRALGTRVTDILKIRSERGVNIESLLIGSAEAQQWLNSDKAQNNTETYQRIHKAKTLYAPLAEIISFDGMGMALQSKSELLQLEFSGRPDLVALAHTIADTLGTPNIIEERAQVMLEAVLGENIHEQVLTHAAAHGIVIGEGIATHNKHRIVWRAKTVGGIARRLCQLGMDKLPPQTIENMLKQPPEHVIKKLLEKGMLPIDLLAATVLTQTPEEIGRELRAILQRTTADTRVILTPSPSRDKPLHVKGDLGYLAAVARGMGYADIDEMGHDVDVKTGAYHVGKVTLRFQRWGEPAPLPAEVQFNTVADRVVARIGSASHAQYRLAEGEDYYLGPQDTAALADFNAKKMHLGQNGLTLISRGRADEMMYRFDSARP